MLKRNQIKAAIFLISLSLDAAISAQAYFNILPQSDGQTNQSRLFDSFLDSNHIYVIGDLLDTTINPLIPQIRAWYSIYNYNGEQILRKLIYHDKIKGLMEASGSRIIRKHNGNFLYNTLLFPNDKARSLIIEVDDQTGEVLNYLMIQNPYDTSAYILPGWISYSKLYPETHLYVNQIEANSLDRIYVLRIDTLLNIQADFVVDDNGRNNYAYYLEEDSDSTFIIIGESWKRNDPHPIPEVKLFFMRVNEDGRILEFKLGQSINSNSVLFSPADSYNVFRDKNGNFILNAQMIVPNGTSPNGFYTLLYSFSYSSNFDSINWAINLSETTDDIEQRYAIYSTEYEIKSNSFTVIGSKLNQEYNDSFITKLSIYGDSLWTRHYIPLNWEPEEVAWTLFRDIKSTPYNSLISVGHASQYQPGLWRSWMIHIDSFGCLIPGCQNIVSINEIENKNNDLIFTVYPNPFSDFLGILSKANYAEELTLSLYDLKGEIYLQEEIQPKLGYQYLLDTNRLLPGLYILGIYNKRGIALYVNKVIKIS